MKNLIYQNFHSHLAHALPEPPILARKAIGIRNDIDLAPTQDIDLAPPKDIDLAPPQDIDLAPPQDIDLALIQDIEPIHAIQDIEPIYALLGPLAPARRAIVIRNDPNLVPSQDIDLAPPQYTAHQSLQKIAGEDRPREVIFFFSKNR